MKRFFEKILSSIEGVVGRKVREIRDSDNKTKRIWLIGMSTSAMIFIIVLWIFYQSFALPEISTQNRDSSATSTAVKEESAGFYDRIDKVFSEVIDGATKAVDSIKSGVNKKREIKIDPNNTN